MKIPFVDLQTQYQSIRLEVHQAIDAVLEETAFIGGPYVKKFEEEFAAYCQSRFAIGVSNGTDALRLALLGCGVGQGDEVITVPNTFIATAEAINMVGAQVRFVDVEQDSLNMDARLLERAITKKTKAVIPVHLYGRVANMEQICAVARKHNLKVIGDAAQAHGAVFKGKPVGQWGDATCFSFYPGKNLGAYGDAGAVVTENAEVAAKVARLRDHGRTKKYEHELVGFNCRLDGLQAAVLSVKLRHLARWTQQRIDNAVLYQEYLRNVDSIVLPQVSTDHSTVFHLFVVRSNNRSVLQELLQEKGIATGVHYPIPLHRQPSYAYLGLGEGSFPIAEQSCREVLSLPMFPELSEQQIRYVADQLAGT